MIRHYSPTDHRRSIPLFRWKSSMFLPQIQGARARGRHDGRAVDPTDRRTIFVFFCGCWSRWSRWILGFVQGFRLMRCYLSWIWILGAIETLNGKKPKNNLRDIYIHIYIHTCGFLWHSEFFFGQWHHQWWVCSESSAQKGGRFLSWILSPSDLRNMVIQCYQPLG